MSRPSDPRAVLLLGTHSGARSRAARAMQNAVPCTRSRVLRARQACAPETTTIVPTSAPDPRSPLHVVELEDGSEPSGTAEVLLQQLPAHITAVVAVVESHRLITDLLSGETAASAGLAVSEDDPRTLAEVLLRQIDFADHVVVLGTGAPEQAPMCRALVNHLNPQAHVLSDVTREHTAGLFRKRFDLPSASKRIFPAFPPPPPTLREATDEAVTTAVWRRSRPVHPGRLFDVLDEMTATSVRSRGRLWLADHPDRMVVWDSVGSSVSIELGGAWTAALPPEIRHLENQFQGAPPPWLPGSGDRCQHIAFTGLGTDTSALFRSLDSCLLDENEIQAEAHGGDPPANPFLPLFSGSDHPDA